MVSGFGQRSSRAGSFCRSLGRTQIENLDTELGLLPVDEARMGQGLDRIFGPVLPTLASWVGYDLDGRTDIHWSQSITLRLREKAAQLAYYRGRLSNFAGFEQIAALEHRLAEAQAHTETAAEKFGRDLSDPDTLSDAANFLTGQVLNVDGGNAIV